MSRCVWKCIWILFLATALAVTGCRKTEKEERYAPRPAGTLTFNKDIAPIVFNHCAGCHREGQSAPFTLLSYSEVKKRAKQIAEVTESRLMPPWLPEHGYGNFVGERRLSTDEIGRIRQWASEGAAEGAASDLPALPKWTEGWQLGQPDLVVKMPLPYTLPAQGKDVYRNFVVPVPAAGKRFVQAVEFRVESKAVHHIFMRVDPSKQARRLDAQDAEVGFDGMDVPPGVESPMGHFLAWQPGRTPAKVPQGLAWALEANTDLVLQAHMRPTGKPETVALSIAFYFTDQAPTNTPTKVALDSLAIDIPPGARDYTVKDSYVLPVDAEVLAVVPHTHYLGKELQGFATLPDGTKKWLVLIKNWDFNWQGDYRYAEPVFLPKGTTLSMQFSFDNSTNNVRNPNQPPQRVKYGTQSTDEMAELWFQLLPRTRSDLDTLNKNYSARALKGIIAFNEYRLGLNPRDARAHNKLGQALLFLGQADEAYPHLRTALEIDPDLEEPHYFLGLIFRMKKNLPNAKIAFENALLRDPENVKAHGNLGLVLLEQNNLSGAEEHLLTALHLKPDDGVAEHGLGLLYFQQGNLDLAETHLRTATQLNPGERIIQEHLRLVLKARADGKK